MRDKITDSLNAAIKEQDKRRISTLRLIKAAIQDRDIAARSKGSEGVSDEEILDILAKLIKQRRDSIQFYEEAGRLELAAQEQEEVDIIAEFMPVQMSEDEIAAACKRIVIQLGAQGLKDMGRTMGALKKEYAGSMDFAKAGKIVRDLLTK